MTLTANCAGGGVPTSFQWTGPGVTGQTTQSVTTNITSTSPFSVTASNAFGASPAATTTVAVTAAPSGCSISASPPTLPAGGGLVTLTATCTGGTAPTTYLWTGPGVNGQTTQTVQANISSTSTFTVTASNTAGASPAVSITVNVTPQAASRISVVSGGSQVGAPGQPLPQPIVLLILDQNGNPLPQSAFSLSQLTTVPDPGVQVTLSTQPTQPSVPGQFALGATFGPTSQVGNFKICSASVPTQCAQINVMSIQKAVVQPALSVVTPAITTAVNAPTIQLNNLRQRLDEVRRQVSPASLEALQVSYDGKPLPPLSALALAPPDKNGNAQRGGGASADKPQKSDAFEHWGVFLNGDVDIGRQSMTDAQPGFKLSTYGLTGGVDYRFDGNNVVGAAIGWLKADTDLSESTGSQTAHGYSFSLYGSYVPAENAYIDGILNFGHNTYYSQRSLAVGFASSGTTGNQFGVSVSAGWNYYKAGLTLNPYGRIEYIDAKVSGYTESGPESQILSIGEQKVRQTTLALGGQISYAFSTSLGVLIPNGRLEWVHIAQSDVNGVNAQLVAIPGSNTVITVPGQNRNYGVGGAGLQALFGPRVTGFFNYQGSFGQGSYSDQRYTLGIRIEF